MELLFGLCSDKKSYEVTGMKPRNYEGEVIIPETYEGLPVTQIAYGAFGNTKITSVFIPASVRSIRHKAFMCCSDLESVVIAENSLLSEVEDSVFMGCTRLRELYFHDRLMHVGYFAFGDCDNLHCILPDTCQVKFDTFSGCKEHSTYVSKFPPFADENGFEFRLNDEKNGYVCTEIGKCGFHVYIPETFNGLPVTELKERLFDSLDFAFAHIPGTVTKAGDFIFYGCDDACGVYYGGTREAWKKMNVYTWFGVYCADDPDTETE